MAKTFIRHFTSYFIISVQLDIFFLLYIYMYITFKIKLKKFKGSSMYGGGGEWVGFDEL